MRVRWKAGLGSDLIVVPDAQAAPPHARGLVVAREREVMLGLEPTVVSATEVRKRSALDHGEAPFGIVSIPWLTSKMALDRPRENRLDGISCFPILRAE